MAEENNSGQEISDEEAILKIAQAMKDNAPAQDEKVNIHTFLNNVVLTKDSRKVGNLRSEKGYDELGKPLHTVRGNFSQALIAEKIMNNKFFQEYLEKEAENTLSTSLSREGFILKVAVTQTKQVSDSTRKVKKNSGMFRKSQEISGGDINSPIPNQE